MRLPCQLNALLRRAMLSTTLSAIATVMIALHYKYNSNRKVWIKWGVFSYAYYRCRYH